MVHLCKAFYSHRGILLRDHLRDVGELCAKYVWDCIDDRSLTEAGRLIGKTHDLAKYTEFFQRHLHGEEILSGLSTHSRLSAILSAWIAGRRLSDPFLSSTAFLCVDRHHGSLEDFIELHKTARFLDSPLIIRQIDSIKKNIQTIKDELKELDLEDLIEFINNPKRGMDEVRKFLEDSDFILWDEKDSWRKYFTILLFYSSLIDADRKDAGRVYEAVRIERIYGRIPANIVELYREKRFSKLKHPIDELRENIFASSVKMLENILKKRPLPRILTIIAPTGSGKTLLGLYTALKIRETLSLNGKTPRIIYSLPFINIIEQTYDVFSDVLSDYFNKITADLLLKHHHLSFPEGEFHGEDLTLDKMLLLTDAWDSEIIVTTFEQLVRAIIGNRGSLLRKYHNLANSIIILDEVQVIPLESWKLVREVLTNLAEIFNIKIIMMTATMPMIFRGDYEIVLNHERFTKRLNRFTLISNVDEELSPEKVTQFFLSKWNGNSSALIVVNTVKTSKIVYNEVSKILGDKVVRLGSAEETKNLKDSSKPVLVYLSTSVIPIERMRRVSLIKDLLRNGRIVILVSTQVVEAGVDLDFDVAFRDIGPLDSIIQVAGRCNRNWRHKAGSNVYIIRVFDNEGKPEAEKIYGKILPNITINILRRKPIIEEREASDLISNYYVKVLDSCNIESEYLKHIKNLAYSSLSGFSLIREEPKVSIFVEIDKRATMLLKRFRDALNKFASVEMSELFEYKAKLRRLRTDLEGYIVNVWPSRGVESLSEITSKTGIYYVPEEVLSAYYDRETGFIQESEEIGGDYIW